jgi:DNA/RNA endonuclease YhcR with UshA esterase domain
MKLHASIIAALVIVPLAFAEEPKPAEPAKPVAPAVEKVFAPMALEELKQMLGKKITVEGPIVVQGENKAGMVRYLNFTTKYRSAVSLTFFTSAADTPFTKEKLAEYVGKKVRVTGELGEFNGSLQIKIAALDQIKIVE